MKKKQQTNKTKQSVDKTLHRIFYLKSKVETIINGSDIDDVLNQSMVLFYLTHKN